MKRLLPVLVAISLVVAGCSSTGNTSEPSSIPSPEPATISESPTSIPETTIIQESENTPAPTSERQLPAWNTVVVDSDGNVGEYSSIAVDGNGTAHIAYFDYLEDEHIGDDPVPYGNLKYASNASGNWEAVTIDTGAGTLPRICIDDNNKVHIVHSKLGASDIFGILDLKYSTNESGSWKTVAISSQVVKGVDSSISADSNGKVHISTRNEEGTGTTSEGSKGGLRYVTNATGEWAWIDVDTSPTSGNDTDITMDRNDKVHISYLDKSEGLKYATTANGSWEVFNIDDAENVGWNTSIVTDNNNAVHISHSDPSPVIDPPGNGYLKYATNTSGTWTTQVIDDEDAGAFTGLAVDNQDNLHISYYTTDGTGGRLMYITNASGSWTKEIADEGGQAVGTYCAIDVDPDGNPHISHYDYIDQNVRYTTRR